MEILTQSWFWRGVVAATLVGFVCSLLSVFVVLRRMAFIGQGISHAAFGGIALGLWISGAEAEAGPMTYLVATIFAVAVALSIGLLSRGRRMTEDSAIGIFFSTSMALGIVILSQRSQFTGEVTGFLFGHVFAVTPGDLVWIGAVGGFASVLILATIRPLYALCYDEELASASGIAVVPLQLMLYVLLALVIVEAMKVVGVVLVSALLVMPAATARLVTYRFGVMVWLSVLAGVGSAIVGILTTVFVVDAPSGAAIVLVQFALLLLAAAWARYRGRPRGHAPGEHSH